MEDTDGNDLRRRTLDSNRGLRFLCIGNDGYESLSADGCPLVSFTEQSVFRSDGIVELPEWRNVPQTDGEIMALLRVHIERMRVVEDGGDIGSVVRPDDARFSSDHRRIDDIVTFHRRCEDNVEDAIISK